MTKFFLPLCLCLSLSLLAQKDIILTGQIQNDVSDKDFVSVINLTSHRGTITDSAGRFEIPVQVNDIIDISALQFKNKKFIVTETMARQRIVNIKLEEETTILPEMTISTATLSGNLSQDMESIDKGTQLPTDYLGTSRRIPTPAERRLYTATTRGEDLVEERTDLRFDIPLNAVFNAVSGRTKNIKTLIDKQRALKQVVALENKFAPTFFTEALEIEVSKIEDFLFYAQAVNDTVYNHEKTNDLALLEALVKEATAYKNLNITPNSTEK